MPSLPLIYAPQLFSPQKALFFTKCTIFCFKTLIFLQGIHMKCHSEAILKSIILHKKNHIFFTQNTPVKKKTKKMHAPGAFITNNTFMFFLLNLVINLCLTTKQLLF